MTQDFVDQMMGVLARQLIQLDGRISTDKSVDAVALGNIAKTYEKIQELTKADQVDEGNCMSSSDALEELRRELSDKLAKLSEPH